MKRIRLLAVMVVSLAIPAAAQVMQVQRIQPPPVVVPVLPAPTASRSLATCPFDPALDPDKARALIAKLRTEKRALRDRMAVTLGDLQNARTVIDEMTRAGAAWCGRSASMIPCRGAPTAAAKRIVRRAVTPVQP